MTQSTAQETKRRRSKSAVGRRQRAFFDELLNESDRGCVIVAAALIEELTERLLHTALRPASPLGKKALKSLLQSRGPLASSWAHNQLLLITGRIDDSEYEDLEVIRRLRNRFAHGYTSARFADRDVQDIVFGMHGMESALNELKDVIAAIKNPKQPSVPKTKRSRGESKGRVARLVFTLIAARFAGQFEGYVDGHESGYAEGRMAGTAAIATA